MTSTDDKSADGDDPLDSPPDESVQSSPGVPMHMYPFAPSLAASQAVRSKRRQVKNACTNCQRACKKCDEARPCLRCVKYGISEECMDSQRKERKKGAKRGPYKKRDGKGNNVAQSDDPSLEGPFMGPVQIGYPPGFYAQFPPPPGHKPGEMGPAYYPQFHLAPAPPPNGQEGEGVAYPPPPQFFPAAFMAPYAQPYPPYVMYARPDGQVVPHYPPYPGSSGYVKPPEDIDVGEASSQPGASTKE
ncbi:hypothetical protein B0H10DRAFT_2223718 [Mycena sp. CBHHK59/15]|nr:hypothetical protein B0H10DRAFT_2223718 [Mycena sp. CBHHK59/15]